MAHIAVPSVWLRDHCQCPQCVHPSTKQRLIETFDEIHSNISPESIKEDVNAFHVTWNDGHQSVYSKAWLQSSGEKVQPRSAERQGIVDTELWTGTDIKNSPPTINYDFVMRTDDGLKEWLHLIRKYGFSYIEKCPVTPEATEKIMERIAFIRPTHYGGFYDFTSDLAKGDTAYTQLGIGAHTDNTYFSDPAGLQMFHLLSHPDGKGGTSQLVDGFAAAQALLTEDPVAYELLSTVRVHSHASGNEDSSVQPYQAFPTLVHDPQEGHLVQVRWNTTDRAAIDLPIEEMQAWYDAAR
jgi:trimethyllysine dioxygenase